MALRLYSIATWAFLLTSSVAGLVIEDRLTARQGHSTAANLTVDLGYAIYQGQTQNTTGLSVWKGIRYAAPPTGPLRWAAPQAPSRSRSVTLATEFGPVCPQAQPSVGNPPFTPGNEDCLFLNVYVSPSVASVLQPVLVWIHGGGYGFGDGRQDLSELMKDNNGGFVVVSIQYRLGAFGFLSSNEVRANGVLNAGILDMKFALEWVQKHITKFGGDPRRVTISGISAGGGAVMLLGIAEGGSLETSLFQSGIAGSPYLPAQYDYNATKPTQLFHDFATDAGCPVTGAVLDCLRSKDSLTLQYANSNISISQTYGTWAFLPVTDYSFIESLPSVALHGKRVNGRNILVGNNANEGALLVPQNISTLDGLKAWMRLSYPTLKGADIEKVLDVYHSTDAPDNPNSPKFATNGLEGATAVNVSQVATGHQQRANNIYAEATFVCPSYWLNNAYSLNGLASFHYQYSVPFASHGDDVSAIFGPAGPHQPPSFTDAVRRMWGSFIKTTVLNTASNPLFQNGTLPPWSADDHARMLNLNTTGGTPYQSSTLFGVNVTQFQEPGLRNALTMVSAYPWEGGRGARCEFWKSFGEKVPM